MRLPGTLEQRRLQALAVVRRMMDAGEIEPGRAAAHRAAIEDFLAYRDALPAAAGLLRCGLLPRLCGGLWFQPRFGLDGVQ